jgi:hypothetical protein
MGLAAFIFLSLAVHSNPSPPHDSEVRNCVLNEFRSSLNVAGLRYPGPSIGPPI